MSDLAIRAEGLGKRYRLGTREPYRTLRETLPGLLAAPLRGLQRAVSPGGEGKTRPDRDDGYIWALKDVSFEVRRGEVVGIIGRNGAGKSTLLKILARITEPTEGRAEIYGRVGSLLEVGTGFHPELTGRENIYLSGALLGMKRQEIDRRFDEIVEFAEIGPFLDTPVKRYSSGMYVRLAFAVAAHLEPEILLVDEVLAVGDAAFQKKCLGKMGEVAREGRTVLFVSHNFGAIRSLCGRAFLFDSGRISLAGHSSEVISGYLEAVLRDEPKKGEISWFDRNDAPGCGELVLRSIKLIDRSGHVSWVFQPDESIKVEICYEVIKAIHGIRFNLYVFTEDGEIAFSTTDHSVRSGDESPGRYRSICTIPGMLLNRRRYVVAISCDIPGIRVIIPRTECLTFSIVGQGNHGSYFPEVWPGVVCPSLTWRIEKLA